MKTGLAFEVLDVLDRSGGKVVDDVDLVAALDVSVSKMRSDKTGAACDKYSQPFSSLRVFRDRHFAIGGLFAIQQLAVEILDVFEQTLLAIVLVDKLKPAPAQFIA